MPADTCNLMGETINQILRLSDICRSHHPPFDKSSDVIFPGNTISLAEQSVRVSQKRIFLSKWPEIIVDPEPSVMTKSLQLEPANFVSMPEKSSSLGEKLFYLHLIYY